MNNQLLFMPLFSPKNNGNINNNGLSEYSHSEITLLGSDKAKHHSNMLLVGSKALLVSRLGFASRVYSLRWTVNVGL